MNKKYLARSILAAIPVSLFVAMCFAIGLKDMLVVVLYVGVCITFARLVSWCIDNA